MISQLCALPPRFRWTSVMLVHTTFLPRLSGLVRHLPSVRTPSYGVRIRPGHVRLTRTRVLVSLMRRAWFWRTRPSGFLRNEDYWAFPLSNVIVLAYASICTSHAFHMLPICFLTLSYNEAVRYFVTILSSRTSYYTDSQTSHSSGLGLPYRTLYNFPDLV